MSSIFRYSERIVALDTGDVVDAYEKGKSLRKFGKNSSIGTSYETLAEMQGAEVQETFVSTNIIDSISSSSASDTTQSIIIEGHTIDESGNLTFAIQTCSLNGQTEVTLTTPLARVTRAYVANSGVFNTTPANLVGTVYIYDNSGGIAAGVPSTASATKALIKAGQTQTAKCATTISQNDYWFINSFSAGVGNAGGSANRVTFRILKRDIKNGGAWRPAGREINVAIGGSDNEEKFDPPLVIGKNHDVIVQAKTDSNTAEGFAELQGVLATLN